MSSSPQTLAKWLRRRPPDHLSLQLMVSGEEGSGELVQEWSAAELQQETDPLVLAREVIVAGNDRAEMQGEVLRLCVRWTMPEGERPVQIVIKCSPPREATDGLDFGTGDAGDKQGMNAHAMRHLDNMHKLYAYSLRDILAQQGAMIADLRAPNAELVKKLRRMDPAQREDGAETNAEGALLESTAVADAIEKVGTAIATHIVPMVADVLKH